MPSLPTIFLILAALSSGAAVIAVIVTIRANRESQSAIFPIVKEEEALKARRARISIVVWLAITALLLGGWLAALQFTPADAVTTTEVESPAPTATLLPPEPVEATPPAEILPLETTSEPALLPTNTPNFTATPPESTATPTPTAIPPTDTPVPTPTPAATNTPTPEPTATPTTTATPTATTPPVVRAETSERNPAPIGVRIGPIKFGADINDNFELIDPSKLFPANTTKVYAAFPFRGMADGLNFTAVWYKNGVEFSRDEVEWPYGAVGASYRFITLRGEGLYKLELLVNDTVAATSLFELR
jgi:hypothetical protein